MPQGRWPQSSPSCCSGTLPAQMATHFTPDGTADGFSSPATAIGLYMLAFAFEVVGVLAVGLSTKSALSTTRLLVVLAAWPLRVLTCSS
ncbi:DUF1648 domain-containing protein [Streptomyces sp. NPDC051773]|uniref:DUF1648 domain-containing protein n=1 Tax=Streptomyces sp. NPDC051773 TaxID=3156682 RepID=UPI003425E3ED